MSRPAGDGRGPAVSLRDVRFSWPGAARPFFDGLSLDFPAGEATCLIGPNGAGKSTLLELILGWRRPGAGTIAVEGRPLADLGGRQRGRAMALVPQEERLPFAPRAAEYVLLGRAPHNPALAQPSAADRAAVMEALERAGAADLADREIHRLSGGERRLVLIARALAQGPRILLLDEPANHLDPANRERVLGVLRALIADGVTLLMSSHEPDMVARLAHRVVLLSRGRPPEAGDPGEMLDADRLGRLYGVAARVVEAGGRRVILWGDDPGDAPASAP